MLHTWYDDKDAREHVEQVVSGGCVSSHFGSDNRLAYDNKWSNVHNPEEILDPEHSRKHDMFNLSHYKDDNW